MTTRELFQSKDNAALRGWWQQVISDQKFEQVLLYARSDFLDASPTKDQLDGAKQYEYVLKTLHESSQQGSDMLAKVAEAARLQPVDHLLTRKTNKPEE